VPFTWTHVTLPIVAKANLCYSPRHPGRPGLDRDGLRIEEGPLLHESIRLSSVVGQDGLAFSTIPDSGRSRTSHVGNGGERAPAVAKCVAEIATLGLVQPCVTPESGKDAGEIQRRRSYELMSVEPLEVVEYFDN